MEEFLQCSICCINFDEKVRVPRQLPCQHNLCSVCLPYMLKPHQNNVIECPTCRQTTSKSLNEIPKSLVIIQLIEATQTKTSSPGSISIPVEVVQAPVPPPLPAWPPQTSTSNSNSANGPSAPPSYYSSQTQQQQHQPISTPAPAPPVPWDYRVYLKGIFNEMDANRDNSITIGELQLALRKTQASSDFSLKTVELLVSKYDKNGDREIDFNEFYDLFVNLSDEYEAFLMMDSDDSGSIDIDEFSAALDKKGYEFTSDFYRMIMREIERKTNFANIRFDNYIRVAARFDFLTNTYKKTPYFHKESLQSYLTKTFFLDFW